MTTTYLAFRASDGLHHRTDGFIQRMRDGARQPEPAAIEDIMCTFTEEALDAFFLKPAELSGLSGTQRKLVRMATETISRAIRLVIRRSARKMDLAQNRAAAEYMDEIRIPAQDHSFWYIAFPLDPALADQGRQLVTLAREDDLQVAHRAMVAYLHAVTDEAMLWYFHKPLELLQFGPILRKMAEVGVDTTRRASYGVVNKVIPKLEREQLTQSALYYESLQVDH